MDLESFTKISKNASLEGNTYATMGFDNAIVALLTRSQTAKHSALYLEMIWRTRLKYVDNDQLFKLPITLINHFAEQEDESLTSSLEVIYPAMRALLSMLDNDRDAIPILMQKILTALNTYLWGHRKEVVNDLKALSAFAHLINTLAMSSRFFEQINKSTHIWSVMNDSLQSNNMVVLDLTLRYLKKIVEYHYKKDTPLTLKRPHDFRPGLLMCTRSLRYRTHSEAMWLCARL